MNKIFKVYTRDYNSNESDSIFSVLGRNEVGLTKSLASLLFHDNEFLLSFLSFIGQDNNVLGNKTITIFAEQLSNNGNIRRDICIRVKCNNSNTLIVIEAKNPKLILKNVIPISNQLNKYFDGNNYVDVNDAEYKIGITLTKEKLKSINSGLQYNEYISITWKDIFEILNNINENEDSLVSSFYKELKRSNFMKTYNDEVFSPPAGDSYDQIIELGIYCCPADRALRESIYLMPRLSVNRNHDKLGHFNIENIEEHTGRGFALELFEIVDNFIADSNALDAIEDENIREAVQIWLNGRNERLLVFVLGERMPFNSPKFTELQNNSFQGYYKLSDIWGQLIPPSNN